MNFHSWIRSCCGRRRRGRGSLTVVLALLTATTMGCVGEFESEIARSDQALYVESSDLWFESTTGPREISVCWQALDPMRPEEHEAVRGALDRSWSFVADVAFVGWQTCDQGAADIELCPINTGECAWTLPGAVGGVGTSVWAVALDFEYAGCATTHPDHTYRRCMDFITIHEFGHVLGFAHEQNRPDHPETWEQDCSVNVGGGEETFGTPDLYSVMNYCNPDYLVQSQLSATDIRGSQHYYGLGPRFVAALAATIL